MSIDDMKHSLLAIESSLAKAPYVEVRRFERDGRPLHLALTERLRKAARKEGAWLSKELCVTLKNAAYGFDEQRARSSGGRDGIFVMDRAFRPENVMMRKLFARFLDKPGGGVEELAAALGAPVGELLPVRLVSHHMRLLGVLARKSEADWLVLVDCDRSD